jgi:hypothetical protein
MEVFVDQRDFRILEDQDEILVITVEVADSDDLFDPGPDAGNRGRGAEAGKGEKEKEGENEREKGGERAAGDGGSSFMRHFLPFL